VVDGYPILECQICGHRSTRIDTPTETHIEENYDNDYFFFRGKTGYPDYLKEKDILIKHGKSYAKIVDRILKPGRVLDVGCASGFILKGFADWGWQAKGIDPNQKMVDFGKTELGLDLEKGYLESYAGPEKYDLITLIQVIGHFVELDKAIMNLSRLLQKDGLVLIECWDMESPVARLLGKKWHEYSPPTVLHWFSKTTLINLMAQYGFIEVMRGKPKKYISAQHAFSLLKEKSKSSFLKRKLDYLSPSDIGKINVRYPPLDVFWMVFKKNTNHGQ
jgi:SAM-dependent methyltransferase